MSIFDVPLGAEQIRRRFGVPNLTMVDQAEPRFEGTQMAGFKGDGRTSADHEPAPAGRYVLKAKVWRELVWKPGEPKRFVEHVRGEIVELSADDAERLLRAGAVEAITETEAHTPPHTQASTRQAPAKTSD